MQLTREEHWRTKDWRRIFLEECLCEEHDAKIFPDPVLMRVVLHTEYELYNVLYGTMYCIRVFGCTEVYTSIWALFYWGGGRI